MPVAPTYPGVYVEEIPSGVRTIMGVATSITAFVGRALRGPKDTATTINGFGDFERKFGGLAVNYPLGYAVRDFFLNGGSKAVIVRLVKNAASAQNAALKLEAASEGKWGEKLAIAVDQDGITPDVAERFNLAVADLFNLTVYDHSPRSSVEIFRNVSIKVDAGSRRLDRVLAKESKLIAVQKKANGAPDLIASAPANTLASVHPEDPKASLPPAAKFISGSDGSLLTVTKDFTGKKSDKDGMYALEETDLFNLLCIPPDTREGDLPTDVQTEALAYCVDRRAMLIVDPPGGWIDANDITASQNQKLTDLNLTTVEGRNAALFFPRVIMSDPLREDQLDTFVPCGVVAGVMARTDVSRGVWKAPAGLDAGLIGVRDLGVSLTNEENGMLNQIGINCLRSFPVAGRVVWGARTLRGSDQLADEYKYIPVRRTALFIEESLYRGTQWVVFEPNDEGLWSQIRLNVGAFMHSLYRQHAFQDITHTPKDSYFVKCDRETTTQDDINRGIVNIIVGFAPLKPAEFVIIHLQQMAGQIET